MHVLSYHRYIISIWSLLWSRVLIFRWWIHLHLYFQALSLFSRSSVRCHLSHFTFHWFCPSFPLCVLLRLLIFSRKLSGFRVIVFCMFILESLNFKMLFLFIHFHFLPCQLRRFSDDVYGGASRTSWGQGSSCPWTGVSNARMGGCSQLFRYAALPCAVRVLRHPRWSPPPPHVSRGSPLYITPDTDGA